MGEIGFWSTTCSLEVISKQPNNLVVAPPARGTAKIGSR
jgi:hypothetical protein